MNLYEVLQKRSIYQKYHNWYVLDEEFNWDVKKLHDITFRYLQKRYETPVIFCSILEANKIVHDLGDDEDEYLRFATGIYWRELGIIFIFVYETFIPLLETLFHEFRHVMQDMDCNFRHHFELDKKVPYTERITEIDAFHFANEKINKYKKETAIGRKMLPTIGLNEFRI